MNNIQTNVITKKQYNITLLMVIPKERTIWIGIFEVETSFKKISNTITIFDPNIPNHTNFINSFYLTSCGLIISEYQELIGQSYLTNVTIFYWVITSWLSKRKWTCTIITNN